MTGIPDGNEGIQQFFSQTAACIMIITFLVFELCMYLSGQTDLFGLPRLDFS